MADQVQGVPAGITLDAQPHDAATSFGTGISWTAPAGAPPGVTFDAQPRDDVPAAAPSSAADRVMTGVVQSLDANIVQPVKAVAESVTSPPQDHKEQIVHSVGGTPALQMYRFGRYMVDNAEKLIDAPREEYQQAVKDFTQGIQEIQNHDVRGALSSAGSTAADLIGTIPGPGAVVGPKARELTEGARKGGDLATPLARDATDVALLVAGEKAPEMIEGVKKGASAAAKKVGVGGLEPAESLQKAAGGSAGISEKNFKPNMDRAMKYMPAEHEAVPITGTPESLSEAAHSAKTKVWDQVSEQIANHPGETISGQEIADTIKNSVSSFVRDHEASTAKAIDKWADTFAKKNGGQYLLDQAAKSVSEMNAKLADTYKMDPGTRAAYVTRNPQLGMYEDAADALRSAIDKKLEKLGETGSAELRKDYGALAQMERVFERRAITYGRQVPISLKQGLSYMAGLAGHPAAVAAALAEKYLNSPEYLIKNAIKNSAGKGGPVVGPTLQKAVPAGVGAGSWIPFKGGDGNTYEGHPEDWQAIQRADPGAQEIQLGR